MFITLKDKGKAIFSNNTEITCNNGNSEPIEKQAIRVDLHDFGVMTAGANGGAPEALRNYLEDIRNGYIVDENENEGEQIKEREIRQKEIQQLQLEKTGYEAEGRKIQEVQIPALKEQIARIPEEINRLEVERLNQDKTKGISKFNLNLYWPVFVLATIFLYGFYLSAFHTAFFKDMAKAISDTNSENISELLNQVFNKQAFLEFNLHWFAPIIFFVFSMMLHILFNTNKKMRVFLVTGMLTFILVADCLLAFFIEYNSHLIQLLNGITDEAWVFYESPRFYLVLFLGFFTCLGWSLILYAIKQEYLKEDTDQVFAIRKKALLEKQSEISKQLDQLQQELICIESSIQKLQITLDAKMKNLNNIIYSVASLEKRITAFYGGWLTFINNLSKNAQLLEVNSIVFSEFKNLHLNTSKNAFNNQPN